jgi:magnesium chelatase family protein
VIRAKLAEAVGFLTDQLPLEPTVIDIDAVFADASRYEEDFSEVRGQESVKRAVTAAGGGHNILLIGASASSRCN